MITEFRAKIRRSRASIVFAVGIIIVLVVSAVMCFGEAVASASYTLREGVLTIDSGTIMAGRRSFATPAITHAEVIAVANGVRTFGIADSKLCTGIWRYPDIGVVWQVTDCSAEVVRLDVVGETQPILVTSRDRKAFIEQLSNGTTARVHQDVGRSPIRAMPTCIGVVLLVVAGVSAFMIILGPSRIRYLVGDGGLTIRTAFVRRLVDTTNMRARLWSPSFRMRVFGTALPGYYTGIYSTKIGYVRVYAADMRSAGILLEGRRTVFVCPCDPDAMLRALHGVGITVSDSAPE